jgi:hypothetical protein
MCIAETLLHCDEWINDEFLECQRVSDKHVGDYKSSSLSQILVSCSTSFRHEIACLSKLFGHPIMDIKQGVLELYDKTLRTREVNQRLIKSVSSYGETKLR